MRVATWNVNSLRVRLPHLLRWLEKSQTDVVCLQETKLTDDLFPVDALRAAGWEHLAWWGEPTYNGVAIVSRLPLEDVQMGFDDPIERDDKRCGGSWQSPPGSNSVRTARRAWSGAGSGAPKYAMTASPMNLSRVPVSSITASDAHWKT